jgi:hypothetical protein
MCFGVTEIRVWRIFEKGILGHKQVKTIQITLPHGLSVCKHICVYSGCMNSMVNVICWHQTHDFSISWRQAPMPSTDAERVADPKWGIT